MNKLFSLIGIMALAISCSQTKIDNPEISIEELNDHISYLASDSLKGRKPGTPEGRLAATYIRDQFSDFGFKLLGDKGFQYFDVITGVLTGPNNSLSIGDTKAIPDEDFRPLSFTSNSSLDAGVAFCGYGFDINKDDFSWLDYEGIDVNGKWVLLLRADPELDNDESIFIPFAKDRDKVLTAKDKGAAGVLFVSGVEYNKKDELAKLVVDQLGTNSGIPVFHITRSFANKILSSSGQSIEELESKIIEIKNPIPFDCDVTVKGTAEVENQKVKTQNVIAFLKSSNQEFSDEVILIGGHYDHLGLGGPNSSSRALGEIGVHYGADDNASGVASVVEIAEKLAANKNSLKRSVLVMAFAAEEMGLLGSKYFTANPLIDLEKIVAVINIDMVGRLKETNELMVGGTGTSIQGEELLNKLVEETELKLSMSPNGFGPSDHASFYIEELPVFFFSTGAHEDYHTPKDGIEGINFEGLKQLDDFVYTLSENLINSDSTLTFQEAGPMQQTANVRRRSGVTLGIMPNFTSTENNGLGVDGVTPGRPASLGGILKGDIITAIEGKEVTNIYDYMARMNKLEFGQTITVDIIRDGEKKVFLIQLEDN